MTDSNDPHFSSPDPESILEQNSSPVFPPNSSSNSSFNPESFRAQSFKNDQTYSLNGETGNNSFAGTWQQTASPQSYNQWDAGVQPAKTAKNLLVFGILVGIVALVGIIIAIAMGVGVTSASKGPSEVSTKVSTSESAMGKDSQERQNPSGPKVEYVVTADFPVKVRFTDNLGQHIDRFAGGKKAWTKTYNLEEEDTFLEVSVTPEKDDFENTHIMTCEIKVDGKTIKQSDDQYAVSCSDSYQASKTK